MEPSVPATPSSLAAFLKEQADALMTSLADKVSQLQASGVAAAADSAGIKTARPRVMSAAYCLCIAILRKNAAACDARQFDLFAKNIREELKKLYADWKGPFTLDATIQQGAGLYLRDAPNLVELVRSKPDYVFADEVTKVKELDDWLALFSLKAKIQILEAMHIQTHNPAHVPLSLVIHEIIAKTTASLRQMRPVLAETPAQQ